MNPLPIVVAVGDPGGVGPLVSLRAARRHCADLRLVLVGDAWQLRDLAQAEGVADVLREIDDPSRAAHDVISLIDAGRCDGAAVAAHSPSAATGRAQLAALERAATLVRNGHGRALVTGPTSKEAIVLAGEHFIGQTEFLANHCGLADDAVTMMFLGPVLRVALVTTHLAVADIPVAITKARVTRAIVHLAQALSALEPTRKQRLVVSGLNPHAGEAGLFGREEIEVIEPVLLTLRDQAPFKDGRISLEGPTPAEAVFRAAQRGDVHGVVAMFHDQATIASKLLDWGSAVNVTWGLPFVRTSVDHGVAYDAIRSGTASEDGMLAALTLADKLTRGSHG